MIRDTFVALSCLAIVPEGSVTAEDPAACCLPAPIERALHTLLTSSAGFGLSDLQSSVPPPPYPHLFMMKNFKHTEKLK